MCKGYELTKLRAVTFAIVGLMLLLNQGSTGNAQPSPIGIEFQVNSYTTNPQALAEIAASPGGDFVVVWTGLGSYGSDDSHLSVHAQWFDETGMPNGSELQVNSYSTSTQQDPDIAIDADGDAVVVWMSLGSNGTDQSESSVLGQRFNADGAPVGAEFQVNTLTVLYQGSPAVAIADSGSFVVAWVSFDSSAGDSDASAIEAQRFDANGLPIGSEFQCNSTTTGHQAAPSVAVAAAGNFVVVWASDGSAGSDQSYSSVLGQRFDASGAPLGAEFQVNSYTTGAQGSPDVAFDDAGSFIVVWQSGGSKGSDDSGDSIQARRFDEDGTPLDEDFQVNNYTTESQRRPRVSVDSSGSFVVVWDSYGAYGDASWESIQARRFSRDGQPVSDQWQVNTLTTEAQAGPAIAADAFGNFVVAWESFVSGGTDTQPYSIQARRYDGLFRDGFEAGDTSRWSSLVQRSAPSTH
jgi:hypothetical protein